MTDKIATFIHDALMLLAPVNFLDRQPYYELTEEQILALVRRAMEIRDEG